MRVNAAMPIEATLLVSILFRSRGDGRYDELGHDVHSKLDRGGIGTVSGLQGYGVGSGGGCGGTADDPCGGDGESGVVGSLTDHVAFSMLV